MNSEKLQQLTERSAKAVKVAKLIEDLQIADPRGRVKLLFCDNQTLKEYLSREVLIDVIERGRQSLIAESETLLEDLLGIIPGTPPPEFQYDPSVEPSENTPILHCTRSINP